MASALEPRVESRAFGTLPDGRAVEAWILRGAGGLELEVLTYGGIVTRLLAPDRRGRSGDVVLGFEHLEGYLGEHPYFGATVGRVAGRISGGIFHLDGVDYNLPRNDPPNHLHGGPGSIDSRLWEAEPVEAPSGASSLRLTHHSPDGDGGYPGAVDLSVTYTVTPDNDFVFETGACTSCPTPVSLTHHSYFNLAGEGEGDVLDHRLWIDSDTSFEGDGDMTLLDKRKELDGGGGDFRESRRLRDAIPDLWRQHGDLYWLGDASRRRLAARLVDPGSGRVLEVSTSNSCLQMYTGAGLDGRLVGKSGRSYPAFGGLCLECQGYPNAIGPGASPGFGDIVVRPGSPQRHVTVYSFSCDD